ncbi:MAG: DNA polymerase III subunit gamma/tau [Clostridia bacterium]|nr:DNA polymerase III subunit gamma/tau [Clostridia bacterium]
MHVALYRKYRSKTFDDVCGQDHITSILKYQAASGRVSHAYLFCGSRGTGKTSCAKILAKAVNCESPKDGEPCGECDSCRMIDRGNATDVVEMDAASETGVDYIRSIKEEVQYPPALLKKRVYIIDEVHMLSDSAFNALLKTLEEPPEHVVFILATTELYKLPSTVVSRCQRFDFRRIPVDVIVSRLRYIADSEGITLEDEASRIIARQASGGMRDAISLMDLCAGGGADVTVQRVKDILGVSGYETVSNTAKAIAKRDVGRLFEIVADVAASSKDVAVFWRELTSFYRDMLVAKYAADPKSYLDLTEEDYVLLKDSASLFSLAKLYFGSKVLDDAARDMNRMPEMKRITAEFALLKLCDESLDTSVASLSARIDELERKVASFSASGISVREEPPVIPEASGTDEKPKINSAITAPADEVTETPDASAPEDKNENAPDKAVKATPGTFESYDERFRAVPDLSDVAEFVGKKNFMARALLAETKAYLIDDGSVIRIVTSNQFVKTFF